MDWDLQAIVRGCGSSSEAFIDSVMDSPQPESCIFSPLNMQQDVNFKFPDVSETTTILDELEELYKPFYRQTILTASTSFSVPTEVNKKPKKPRKQRPPPPKLSVSASNNDTTDHPGSQPKRGKNQQKRVVQKVTADGLACDKWAWRKYGQKPIKGSPYPRSYYRCSSSKGCLARKQVERSSTDPGIFIITYSAEHNHTHPTRLSSLAGSTRNKASMTRSPAKEEPLEPTGEIETSLVTSIEDEFVHQESIKKNEEENMFEEGTEFVMPDMIFNDELFPSLEDLEGILLDQFEDHSMSANNSWFIDESVTLGGGC